MRPYLPIRYLCILLLLSLTACGPSEDTELRKYIDEIKARPPKPIEPIPEFKVPARFVYPEDIQRRSPFKPIAVAEKVEQSAPNTNRPKQPLEAFPLDALKFVGILKEGSVVWGLISQPNGLVSRVKRGDYLGQNFGQILSIQDTGIKLEETLQIAGKWEKKVITLTLSSPNQGEKSAEQR